MDSWLQDYEFGTQLQDARELRDFDQTSFNTRTLISTSIIGVKNLKCHSHAGTVARIGRQIPSVELDHKAGS
ncbi:hypothetical protein E4U17_003518 [Claviceps sp. LM77 group G4]|nr:hypothetical protein E4U17_003518 [Claviceps sp. LM77 group G4]